MQISTPYIDIKESRGKLCSHSLHPYPKRSWIAAIGVQKVLELAGLAGPTLDANQTIKLPLPDHILPKSLLDSIPKPALAKKAFMIVERCMLTAG